VVSCELSAEAKRKLAECGLFPEGVDNPEWCLALVDWLATQGDLLSVIAKRWEQYAHEQFGI
jgi:hypothetical protein